VSDQPSAQATPESPRVVGIKAHACAFGIAFGPLYEDEADEVEPESG
jgi:hypothetical protein